MAETSHTPGSWINANGLVNGRDSRLEYPDTPSIDIFDASEWPENLSEEAQANARLIAAAPDLLDALQAIVDEFPVAAGTAKGIPHDEQGFGSIYRARAAIARATGEKQ